MKETTFKPGRSSRVIRSRMSRIWKGKDGIIRQKFSKNARVDLKDARWFERAVKKLIKPGERALVLVDSRELIALTDEAMSLMTSDHATRHVLALANVVTHSMSLVIALKVSELGTLPFKMRFFMEEEKALVWLKKFRKINKKKDRKKKI